MRKATLYTLVIATRPRVQNSISPPNNDGCQSHGRSIIAGKLVIASGDAAEIFDPTPGALDKVAGFVGLAVDGPLMLVRWIGGDDGRGPTKRQVHPQLLGIIAHVADQASVGRQCRGQFVGCGDVGDVACGQAKAKQSALTVGDTVDLRRSAAAGAADGLLVRSALSAGGRTLNLDRGAVDGSCVVGHGHHQRVEDPLPAATTAPTVEAIVDRRVGPIDRRTVLPATAAAQDMNNPTNDAPVIMPAGAGMSLGRSGSITAQALSLSIYASGMFVLSIRPTLAGLDQKIPAIPIG